jgi:hypothetical protein
MTTSFHPEMMIARVLALEWLRKRILAVSVAESPLLL